MKADLAHEQTRVCPPYSKGTIGVEDALLLCEPPYISQEQALHDTPSERCGKLRLLSTHRYVNESETLTSTLSYANAAQKAEQANR